MKITHQIHNLAGFQAEGAGSIDVGEIFFDGTHVGLRTKTGQVGGERLGFVPLSGPEALTIGKGAPSGLVALIKPGCRIRVESLGSDTFSPRAAPRGSLHGALMLAPTGVALSCSQPGETVTDEGGLYAVSLDEHYAGHLAMHDHRFAMMSMAWRVTWVDEHGDVVLSITRAAE